VKIRNVFAVSVVLMFVVSHASARQLTGKIIDLIGWSDGNTAIKIQNGPINGCSGQYYYSLGIKGQDVKAEAMLSIALTAYTTNRSVTLSTSDGVCQGGQEKINAIQLWPSA